MINIRKFEILFLILLFCSLLSINSTKVSALLFRTNKDLQMICKRIENCTETKCILSCDNCFCLIWEKAE